MFFELHDERIIGYKTLTDADLGAGTSHQTHIGLSEKLLTFLSDRDVQAEDSVLVYEESFAFLDANFDRIMNPNGTFRSPKIRTGERGAVSVVTKIREIARLNPNVGEWYLLWFGLKGERLAFFLVAENSSDYNNILNAGLGLGQSHMGAIRSASLVGRLVPYLESRIDSNAAGLLDELEVKAETEPHLQPYMQLGDYDIARMNAIIELTGKTGERLVEKFLRRQMDAGAIKRFEWHNESKESARPYDFTVYDNAGNASRLDVKTTSRGFAQKMIFSSQEIAYIASTKEDYAIYRVYKASEESYMLRICGNCKALATQLNLLTTAYKSELGGLKSELRNAKITVAPENASLAFGAEIALA
jgi:hypothetical protein